jgi:hypothetical protein
VEGLGGKAEYDPRRELITFDAVTVSDERPIIAKPKEEEKKQEKPAERIAPSTVSEVEKALVENKIAGRVNLSGMPNGQAVEVNKTLEKLSAEFVTSYQSRQEEGRERTALLGVGMKERRSSAIASMNTQVAQLEFNPKYFNDAHDLEATYKRAMDTGFHPKLREGVSAVEAITTHEFGHGVAHKGRSDQSEIKMIRAKYMREVKTAMFAARAKAGDARKYNARTNKMELYTQEQIDAGKSWMETNFISGYAGKNMDEFIAESFTMARLSPNVSPFAQQTYDVIQKTRGRK